MSALSDDEIEGHGNYQRKTVFKIVRTKDTGGRDFLIDSGATFHMCSYDSLTASELRTLQPLPKPVRILTANGVIIVSNYATVYVSDLDITVNMIVSKDAPLILSMGKLCDKLCDYQWLRGSKPRLTVYKGNAPVRTIHLELSKDCPVCHACVDPIVDAKNVSKA